MRETIFNKDNLCESDINRTVIRIKALLLNSNNEILLGYSHNTYQFPGGHLEEGEDLVTGLEREIKEETGIIIDLKEVTPFLVLKHFNKDYPKEGINSMSVIYYYAVKCDLEVNLELANYTEEEKDGNFELRYINLDNVNEILIENSKLYPKFKVITEEMINALDIYKETI